MKVEVVTPRRIHRLDHRRPDQPSRHGAWPGQPRQRQRDRCDGAAGPFFIAGYINSLRSMSSGRAVFTMQFDHYEAVPQNISDEIQKKYA